MPIVMRTKEGVLIEFADGTTQFLRWEILEVFIHNLTSSFNAAIRNGGE